MKVVCEKLCISELGETMSQKRLRWYGHVARSNDRINQYCEIEVDGPSRRERYNTRKGTVKAELLEEREILVKLMSLTGKSGGNVSQ